MRRFAVSLVRASARAREVENNGIVIDPSDVAVHVLESTRYDCLRIALRKDGTFGQPELHAWGLRPFRMGWPLTWRGISTSPCLGCSRGGRLVAVNQIIEVDRKGD
jgi:hypothetical protein